MVGGETLVLIPGTDARSDGRSLACYSALGGCCTPLVLWDMYVQCTPKGDDLYAHLKNHQNNAASPQNASEFIDELQFTRFRVYRTCTTVENTSHRHASSITPAASQRAHRPRRHACPGQPKGLQKRRRSRERGKPRERMQTARCHGGASEYECASEYES